MNNIERTAVLTQLGRALAPLLSVVTFGNVAWKFVEPTEDNDSVYLQNDEGARIYLQLTSSVGFDKNDRVEVSGFLGIGKNGSYVEVRDKSYNRVTVNSITVALSRGAGQIAREIGLRFIPDYLYVFALAQEQARCDAEYEATITAGLQRLAKAAGTEVPTTDKWQREVRSSFTLSIGEVYGDASANLDSASLKLNCLTYKQAEHILSYLKGGK